MPAGTRASPASRATSPFRTRADYDSYLTRIAQYPRLNDQALAITANAVRGRYRPALLGARRPRADDLRRDRRRPDPVALLRALRRRRGPRRSRRPTGRRCRRGRGRSSPTTINPAYQRHLDFYTREYQPHCARSDSVRDQPSGAEYYAFQVRAADHHRPHPAADPRYRPARGRAHPRRDGRGRARGGLRQPRGLSSRSCAPIRAISRRPARS